LSYFSNILTVLEIEMSTELVWIKEFTTKSVDELDQEWKSMNEVPLKQRRLVDNNKLDGDEKIRIDLLGQFLVMRSKK